MLSEVINLGFVLLLFYVQILIFKFLIPFSNIWFPKFLSAILFNGFDNAILICMMDPLI